MLSRVVLQPVQTPISSRWRRGQVIKRKLPLQSRPNPTVANDPTPNIRRSNMNSLTPSTNSAPPEEPTTKHQSEFSLDDIEETETSMWLQEQLNRIEELVLEHGADDEMLEAIEYLIIENDERWISPEIAVRLGATRTGKA
jgi:hypothetical protein